MESYQVDLEYEPCFFEFSKWSQRWYVPAVCWLFLGGACSIAFIVVNNVLGIGVHWFAALYFIGGLGWVPASMCLLSHAYHRMCKDIYPYFASKQDEHSVQAIYKDSARKIFGYVKERCNLISTICIWIFMFKTVIDIETTSPLDGTTALFLHICYIAVGFMFPCVLCGIIHFVLTLLRFSAQSPIQAALQKGIVEHLKANRSYCTLLNWIIVMLFAALVYAMDKSPLGTQLWKWLPVLGFFPLSLFVANHYTVQKILERALQQEEKCLNMEIAKIIQGNSRKKPDGQSCIS